MANAILDEICQLSQDDLPSDDGIPMETPRHRLQMQLLIDSLEPWLQQREDGYVAGNMFVYFSPHQVRNEDFRGPDVYVALDVPRKERKSWLVWEEGKSPDVVIELLSESTAEFDKTWKKDIYQNQLKTPEYFWFDPFNADDFAGFRLQEGEYEPITPDQAQNLPSQTLGLNLVRWQGRYRDVETVWLRWALLTGELLLTPEEIAEQRAEQAQQRAEQEHQRAEQLAAKLRALGIDPDATT